MDARLLGVRGGDEAYGAARATTSTHPAYSASLRKGEEDAQVRCSRAPRAHAARQLCTHARTCETVLRMQRVRSAYVPGVMRRIWF